MSKNKGNMRNIHLKKVCRCCLTERGHLREIMSTKIPMMIENCAEVKILENDGLPKYVCVSCFHQIAKLYTFKKKIERNDRILRNYIKQRNRMKSKEYSDILYKAVNDAEISIASEDTINTVIVDSKEICYESDEDMPLILRCDQGSQLEKSIKSDKTKFIDSNLDIKNEFVNFETKVLPQVLNDGPPPLVPLEYKKSSDNEENNMLKELPTPPPLVPLKPLPASIIVNNLTNSLDETIDLKLQCSICGEEFSSVAALKEHRMQICQANELQCNICRKEYKDRKRLIGHLKGHMVVKDYRCKICGKCYPNPSTFRIHMRAHTGERPFSCQICNKGFARWAGVVGHMKTHNSHKPHKCDICGKGFKMSSNLRRHKILHTGILPFCCNYCGKTFSQAENLQLHIRTYHTHEKPYLCSECGKGFVSLTRLNRHMWIHSGYKPYRCKYCSKAYSNSNDLKNHERSHSGGVNDSDKPYACKDCDMRFFHPCRLAKHIKIHERPYTCTDCRKTFSTEAVLRRHKAAKHRSVNSAELVKNDTYISFN
ncbi:zinc finger and scan domain-containing [Holotrichia oblita]|uniref:Zinc finger and scan domain-containing n=2 Tax=Holotrichia oblita TaxID=644536 RepID=A0ACB9TEQ5_HOLOL|nr:zinc finger and scan domain-containing [Holotrichia oblita]